MNVVLMAPAMSAQDFGEIHIPIREFLEGGDMLDTSGLSFVAAHVVSLAEQAARGRAVGLLMPPPLAQAWWEHDRRHAASSLEERHKAGFDRQTCMRCGAEHPFLGRYEFSEAHGCNVIANEDEIIKACLVCGGVVGRWDSYNPTSSTVH
jgi:hypothetical protein